ncbi:MAG: TetR/AcrR family transcriptional regulator [Bacteroidia bacterium]|nr:TetR/AcrR family transcriptional regulator [Bacteroidia bacterium]
MKDTRTKIIETAIELFNQHAVGNVRVQDIAKASNISPGNLTYHFRTKKELMKAVHDTMKSELNSLNFGDFLFKETMDLLDLTRTYLQFLVKYRFFYRDIMEIFTLVPEVKSAFIRQIGHIINFNRNTTYLGIGKGLIQPEPSPGIYDSLAKNSWAILNSWLSAREILGEEAVSIEEGLKLVLDMHYPFYTDKGKEFYHDAIQNLQNLFDDKPSKLSA